MYKKMKIIKLIKPISIFSMSTLFRTIKTSQIGRRSLQLESSQIKPSPPTESFHTNIRQKMNKTLVLGTLLVLSVYLSKTAEGQEKEKEKSSFLADLCLKCDYCKSDPTCQGCEECSQCQNRKQVTTQYSIIQYTRCPKKGATIFLLCLRQLVFLNLNKNMLNLLNN